MRILLAGLGSATMLFSPAARAKAPSFDCAHASHADERAICRSPALSALDARMAALFDTIQGCTAMGGHDVNLGAQGHWLHRRAQCGANRACLTRIYRAHIAELAPRAARADKEMHAGNCPMNP